MRAITVLLAILMLTATMGCASTQCDTLMKSMNAAEAAYQSAKTSNAPMTEVDKWKWTYDAAKAAVVMWCSTVPEGGAK